MYTSITQLIYFHLAKHGVVSPVAKGLLGSPPTGCPAWKQSLDSQEAAWRYQGKLESLEASLSTRPQALAASRAVEGVSNL